MHFSYRLLNVILGLLLDIAIKTVHKLFNSSTHLKIFTTMYQFELTQRKELFMTNLEFFRNLFF